MYRAYQPAVGREVAVKIILPQYANQPDFIRRFEIEAQLVAYLEHPHIVPLYDYWRDPDGAYLVMRWLPHILRTSIERGPWSPLAVARLLDQITAALTVAYRDIKPDNILLDEDENVYLADFGIAKDLSMRDFTDNELAGSPAYISPEQIRSQEVTPRSDIYSLGFVLYELLTGEKAFPDAQTPSDYLQKHLSASLPPLSPSLPRWTKYCKPRQPKTRRIGTPMRTGALSLSGQRYLPRCYVFRGNPWRNPSLNAS